MCSWQQRVQKKLFLNWSLYVGYNLLSLLSTMQVNRPTGHNRSNICEDEDYIGKSIFKLLQKTSVPNVPFAVRALQAYARNKTCTYV